MFAPCEKVLIDQDNNASVISVFQEIRVSVPAEKIPSGLALPITWQVFTLWLREASDEGRRFEQVCELVLPDGKTVAVGTILFQMEKNTHRNIMTVMGFPVAPTVGDCSLRLMLRDAGTGHESRIAEFPIALRFATVQSK